MCDEDKNDEMVIAILNQKNTWNKRMHFLDLKY